MPGPASSRRLLGERPGLLGRAVAGVDLRDGADGGRAVAHLEAEAADLETQIEQLVRDIAGWLLDEPGVGPITTD